ncbi:MAG TPA: uroporphyrinogen-III C-methyltransferase [Acidimicrobiales bacterium]|nr:uroporphyrinogen-III C-methyltransferase [Acidimicrobiales bacterium]
MAFGYPLTLDIRGRRCVVIGGGPVAEHKCRGLLDAGGVVVVVTEKATQGLEDLRAHGLVELVRRPYAYGDLDGALLAVAATDDPSVHAEVFKEGDERGVLVNTVDDVSHSHFAVPSVVRRDDVTVAISTGGKAPALAKRLRSVLDPQLGVELEAAADLPGGVEEPAAPEKGRVAIVGAGPGDPGLLTVRGRELLDAADVVVHDRLVDPSLVEGGEAVFVGKEAGHHSVPQQEINALLVELAANGLRVVRLKGGDPFVFGRGGEEAEALADSGIDFEVVPAPTSAFAALAYAGIPVTHRGLASSVAVVTGHCTGDQDVDWRELATAVDTVVVLMPLAGLGPIGAALVEGGRHPGTPAAVVENGTNAGQRVVTAELGRLADAAHEAGVRSPALVVVGEVVRLRDRIAWFEQS